MGGKEGGMEGCRVGGREGEGEIDGWSLGNGVDIHIEHAPTV